MSDYEIDPTRLDYLGAIAARENAAAREGHDRCRGFAERRRAAESRANEFRARVQQRYGIRTPREVDTAKLEEVEGQEAEERRREEAAKADYERQQERWQAAARLHERCSDWCRRNGYSGAN